MYLLELLSTPRSGGLAQNKLKLLSDLYDNYKFKTHPSIAWAIKLVWFIALPESFQANSTLSL